MTSTDDASSPVRPTQGRLVGQDGPGSLGAVAPVVPYEAGSLLAELMAEPTANTQVPKSTRAGSCPDTGGRASPTSSDREFELDAPARSPAPTSARVVPAIVAALGLAGAAYMWLALGSLALAVLALLLGIVGGLFWWVMLSD